MDLQLKGKKAILVGANGGIGRQVAHVLAEEGCDVARTRFPPPPRNAKARARRFIPKRST